MYDADTILMLRPPPRASITLASLYIVAALCGCSDPPPTPPPPPPVDVPAATDIPLDSGAPDIADVPALDTPLDLATDTPDTPKKPADVTLLDATADVSDAPPDTPDVPVDTGPVCEPDQTLCGTRCVDTRWDPTHCGACDNLCPPGRACSLGRCGTTCDAPRALCVTGGLARCVDLLNDTATCGTCERACSEGQACSNGRCVCAPGRTLCGMRCADTESDPGNCGGCGVTCPAVVNGRAACRARACGFACAEGYHACGNSCVADSSPLTCGTLCVPCPAYTNATPTCNGVSCGFACIMGYHQCGAACVSNLAVANCGTLCTPCPGVANGTATCNGTECGFTCNTGFHRCGDMCLSNTAPASCGTLCEPCAFPPNATATCNGTACGFACVAGYGNCDADANNGCEVDTRVVPEHCGACGRPCVAPANARATCTASVCGFACNTGFGNCDANAANGCETDTNANTAHCGMCGRACATGEVCAGGGCRAPRLGWSAQVGGGAEDVGHAIARDASGSLYVVGRFRERVSLSTGTLVSAGGTDGFVASFTPDGALRWARRVGSSGDDAAFGVAVDAMTGHVYVTGRFRDRAEFDGTFLTSGGESDIFVASWTSAGMARWVRAYGVEGADAGYAVTTDAAGDVYVTGTFRGNVDFGGGALEGTAGGDVFVLSLNTGGGHRWSRRFGGTPSRAGGGTGYALTVSSDGSVYATGLFSGSVDFGSDLVISAGNFDVFVESLAASSGAHQWVRRFGAGNVDWGFGVVADAMGNVYFTGYFQGAVDFGGGALSGGVGTDGFLASYTRMGTHRWSRRFGGSTSYYGNATGQAVTLDAVGNVVVAGSFAGNVDFGGGLRTSVGDNDIFVASWTNAGAARWSRRFGAERRDEAHGVTTDASGNVYATGEFDLGVDFGAGRVDTLGGPDAFVFQYVQ